MLDEGDAFGINGNFGAVEKKSLVLILVKQTQNFLWVCIIIVICFLMERKS